MSRPDFDEAEDLAYLDQLAADLDADRIDAADVNWSKRLMSDEQEAMDELLAETVNESEAAYTVSPELGSAWERLNARSGCCGRPVRRLGHGLRCDREAE